MTDLLGLIWDNIVILIYIIDVILIFATILCEGGDPSRSIIWIAILLVLPIIGFFLYIFIGQTFYTEWAFRKKGESDKFNDGLLKYNRDSDRPEISEKDRIMMEALERSGSNTCLGNNDVRFICDSTDYFDSLLDDLNKAEKSIEFEYYIIRNDEVSNRLMDILVKKARSGIRVRVMIDALGFSKGQRRKITELKNAGGEFSLFHSTATCLLSPKKNNRNHRKIAIIDSRIGYVGGFNIGDEYLGKGPLGHWRDSAVRICGNGVVELTFRFLADWRYATKKDEVKKESFRDFSENCGDIEFQLVSGGPDMVWRNPIQMQYFSMVLSAEKSLYIHTPYLEPDVSLVDALRKASYSGVDVKIIIPSVSDHPFVYWANRYYANILMESGVRVFEYKNGFVHSKTIVADEHYCSIGSANFDDRSMKLNFETNAMIYSDKIGRDMAAAFSRDLEDCTEYTQEMYAGRTIFQKLKTGLDKLVSGQL